MEYNHLIRPEPGAAMSTAELIDSLSAPPEPDPTLEDPWFYGYRYVTRIGPDGTEQLDQVPLTEMDVLHPEEDDFIVQNDAHSENCNYLKAAFQNHFRARPDVLVFEDHRVDWQHPTIRPHGPDLAVFEGAAKKWPEDVATFRMRDAGARPLLVVEVTSPTTRKGDVGAKIDHYHQIGVPYYVIVDRRGRVRQSRLELRAFQTTPEGYVPMAIDPVKGVYIPTVNLWFRIEANKIVCLNRRNKRYLRNLEMVAELEAETDRAEQADQRADHEKARAEKESTRAEQEKARAEREKARAETQAMEAARERARAEEKVAEAERERTRNAELERELAALRAQLLAK